MTSKYLKLGKILFLVKETFRFSAKLVDEKYSKIQKLQIKFYISEKNNDIYKNLKSL